MMKRLLALALLALAPYSANAFSMPPEYKACHAGDRAACKKWRDRECRKGTNSACDYDTARKQADPAAWCSEHWGGASAWEYRWCLNGSPDH
jgi:hypothetical protein